MDNFKTIGLMGGVLAALTSATAIGQYLKQQGELGLNAAVVETFNNRIRSWWLMCTVLAAAFALGSWSRPTTVLLFGLISFWALREFITLTPTRLGDHRTLFWVFFLFTPLQYVLVGHEQVRTVHHPDPGLCVLVHPLARGPVGRLQAVSGADGQDSGRPDGLRLLLEPRAGAALACTSPAPTARVRTPGCCSSSCWSCSSTTCFNMPGAS